MASISYQLYSSRNFAPLSNILAMVSNAGYTQVEGHAGLIADSTDAESLRELLEKEGLSMPTCHFDLEMVKKDPRQVIEIAGILNIDCVYIPYLEVDNRPSDTASWRKFAYQLNEWGKPLRDANLTFGWHNHDFEFTEITSSIRPIDIILSASNYISLELDVAWAMSTDTDVLNFVSQHRARISAAHIKDIAPAGHCLHEDGWADVGHGTLDWESLFPALLAAGTQYFIMEHDNPTDDKRFAKRSIEYASPLLNSLR